MKKINLPHGRLKSKPWQHCVKIAGRLHLRLGITNLTIASALLITLLIFATHICLWTVQQTAIIARLRLRHSGRGCNGNDHAHASKIFTDNDSIPGLCKQTHFHHQLHTSISPMQNLPRSRLYIMYNAKSNMATPHTRTCELIRRRSLICRYTSRD